MSCADPDNSARGGSNFDLFFVVGLVDEGWVDNGVSLVC